MGGPPTVTGCSCVDPQRTSTSFPGVLITEPTEAVAHQEFGGNVADPLAGAHVAPVAWSSARFARCGFLCPTPEPGWTWLPQRVEAPTASPLAGPGSRRKQFGNAPGGPREGGRSPPLEPPMRCSRRRLSRSRGGAAELRLARGPTRRHEPRPGCPAAPPAPSTPSTRRQAAEAQRQAAPPPGPRGPTVGPPGT